MKVPIGLILVFAFSNCLAINVHVSDYGSVINLTTYPIDFGGHTILPGGIAQNAVQITNTFSEDTTDWIPETDQFTVLNAQTQIPDCVINVSYYVNWLNHLSVQIDPGNITVTSSSPQCSAGAAIQNSGFWTDNDTLYTEIVDRYR